MVKVKAYAKINLYLDVIGRRSDGYYNIRTIMQKINLADELIVKGSKKGIKIICNKEGVPSDKSNTVYKAVELLREYVQNSGIKKEKFTRSKGVEIKIDKNIPVAAGLGGGSSDAAGVLIALNKLWDLGLSLRTLEGLGSRIGADVPFFIRGGTAYCYGRGDKIKRLQSLGTLGVILLNPGYHVSTKWAYGNLKLKLTNKKNDNIIQRYAHIQRLKGDRGLTIKKLEKFLYNDLEETVIKKYPSIGKIKYKLKKAGVEAILMSGSGSTVFGLVPTQKFAEKVKEVLQQDDNCWIWVGKTRK